uniref:Secreted protein n=1 Tax=Strongyloides stercoralis TaxID=6248 RepID=A0A0K0ETS7_STRER
TPCAVLHFVVISTTVTGGVSEAPYATTALPETAGENCCHNFPPPLLSRTLQNMSRRCPSTPCAVLHFVVISTTVTGGVSEAPYATTALPETAGENCCHNSHHHSYPEHSKICPEGAPGL